ncbi:MAG: YifB family Mg chelatase-like AAA ATPase [Oscillospiraceae bacterium]
MLSKLYSFGVIGIDGYPVTVETHISGGLPSFDVVGLGDNAVKEARDRVRSAIKNNHFQYPASRITVNLAPADIKKTGAVYDMPIMLGVLCALNIIPDIPKEYAFAGELSLDGEVRGVKGALSMALCAKESGFTHLFVPLANANEASVVDGVQVFGIKHIKEIISFLKNDVSLSPHTYCDTPLENDPLDFKDVKGQEEAKRAMEIAASGLHNILLCGPPGSGKSMLAKRLQSIMPPLSKAEAIETTKIYSIAGLLMQNGGLITTRPFRNPHHTVSAAALAGGGQSAKPGEISLAHNGVLFLDELPEFHRDVLEALRAPLEDNKVTISRVSYSQTYPSNIMLVGAMNPCPCGYLGDDTHVCSCSAKKLDSYKAKLSGPLMDRIDIHVNVAGVNYDELVTNDEEREGSVEISRRVCAARNMQQERFRGTDIISNANIPSKYMAQMCKTTPKAQKVLKKAFDNLGLSARSYDKILKVARTIADLDQSELIEEMHMLEAVQYRNMDRNF